MLKNPPLRAAFPIVQHFGERPDAYADVRCADVPLRGHNGIDFAAPPGTPALAVQDGVIVRVGSEPDGFGNFVLIAHYWGQSLYAHLDRVTVSAQQSVAGGDQIGLTGSSGDSAGPHLHFGMRINPFTMDDGWCGYVDPAPYLQRLTVPRGAIIGPHIIGGIPQHLAILERWQPRLVLILDPNPDEIRRLRQSCPATTIVGRIFEPDNVIDERIRANPKAAAAWAHEKCMARMSPDVDYWQFANEVLQKPDTLPLLNEFELERMRLADANGYKCAIFGFSVGNPDLPENDRMADWELAYPAIEYAEANRHCISLHQYGMPNLWGPNDLYDWYIYRLEHQVLRRLPYKKVQFAVTEYGIDGLIEGQTGGWQKFTTADDYANQLLRSGAYAERFSGRILGYAVFTLGHNMPWGSYDIAGDVAQQLAERSQQGTWNEVDTTVNDFSHTSDISDPGGTGSIDSAGTQPTEPTSPTKPSKPVAPPTPSEPTDESGPGEPGESTLERRLTDWFDHYNLTLNTLADRPDNPAPSSATVYVLKDVFTTYMGSWEPSNEPGSVPQWARDAYLRPEFLEAGADHHLFGAVLNRNGELIKGAPLRFWSDGFHQLGDPNYDGYLTIETKADSGWANNPMGPGSSFVPERGEAGPWCWAPDGAAEVICGGGLPSRHHLSTFAVWQEMDRAAYEAALRGEGAPAEPTPPTPPITEPDDPGIIDPEIGEPVTEPDTGPGTGPDIGEPVTEPAPAPVVQQRISPWIPTMNLRVSGLNERGDNPDPNGEFVYVVKDMFTTYNGSWEPNDKPYSVPQWARDAYLKPWGAPDYFDDAGADHHLFAAIVGPDGELLRDAPIIFWSDGFDKLVDPTYADYIERLTKTHSGWANIPIGPSSSFVPERGESGPWCWAPQGAAAVVCGGGMPAKQHVSTFVVWQQVARAELEPDTGASGGAAGGTAGDHSIFMPIVFGPGGVPANQPAPAAGPGPDIASPQAAPAPGIGEPAQIDFGRIRWSAWMRMGFEGGQNSALAAHARKHKLGMPVTGVYRLDNLVAQAYVGGIVFHEQNKPGTVSHTDW